MFYLTSERFVRWPLKVYHVPIGSRKYIDLPWEGCHSDYWGTKGFVTPNNQVLDLDQCSPITLKNLIDLKTYPIKPNHCLVVWKPLRRLKSVKLTRSTWLGNQLAESPRFGKVNVQVSYDSNKLSEDDICYLAYYDEFSPNRFEVWSTQDT